MTKTKQEMLFGVGWLIVGLATAKNGQVWIGIAMCVFGVFVLAYAGLKAQRGDRER
jgi:succinate-acetate transporter protein